MPRARRSVPLAKETRALLDQCADLAKTTPEELAATLILRDAHARGLLPVETLPSPAPPPRRSVIALIGDDPLSVYAKAKAIGTC